MISNVARVSIKPSIQGRGLAVEWRAEKTISSQDKLIKKTRLPPPDPWLWCDATTQIIVNLRGGERE